MDNDVVGRITSVTTTDGTGGRVFPDWIDPTYVPSTPSIPTVWVDPINFLYSTTMYPGDTGKKAFDLAKVLMEKKLVQVKSVKQFIELVELLMKEL